MCTADLPDVSISEIQKYLKYRKFSDRCFFRPRAMNPVKIATALRRTLSSEPGDEIEPIVLVGRIAFIGKAEHLGRQRPRRHRLAAEDSERLTIRSISNVRLSSKKRTRTIGSKCRVRRNERYGR